MRRRGPGAEAMAQAPEVLAQALGGQGVITCNNQDFILQTMLVKFRLLVGELENKCQLLQSLKRETHFFDHEVVKI